MFYVTPEDGFLNRTGVHFYPLSDQYSFGFRVVRANRWIKFFRWSKKFKYFNRQTTYLSVY